MQNILIVSLVLATFFPALQAQQQVQPSIAPAVENKSSDSEKDRLANAERKFGFKIFKQFAKTSKNKNLAVSPYGVFECLHFLHESTKDKAKSEIAQALAVSPESDITQTAKTLRQSLRPQLSSSSGLGNPVTSTQTAPPLVGQNVLLFDSQFKLTGEAKASLADSFLVEAMPVDWSSQASSSLTAQKVNELYSRATSGRLNDFGFKLEDRSPGSVVFLNLCYFKDSWFKQFDKSKTQQGAFHCADGSLPIANYVTANGRSGKWLETEYFELTEIPYQSKSHPMDMILVLPKRGVPSATVIQVLEDLNCLGASTARIQWNSPAVKIDMKIPKFKLESDQVSLKEVCRNMGVHSIFEPQIDTGIGKLFDTNPQLYVESIDQDAFLQFDEVGTEAAAQTKVEMTVRSMPTKPAPSRKFIADRPFMFFLVDHAGMMYFAGQIAKPAWEGETKPVSSKQFRLKGEAQFAMPQALIPEKKQLEGHCSPPSAAIAGFIAQHSRDGYPLDLTQLEKANSLPVVHYSDEVYELSRPATHSHLPSRLTPKYKIRHSRLTNSFFVTVVGNAVSEVYQSKKTKSPLDALSATELIGEILKEPLGHSDAANAWMEQSYGSSRVTSHINDRAVLEARGSGSAGL